MLIIVVSYFVKLILIPKFLKRALNYSFRDDYVGALFAKEAPERGNYELLNIIDFYWEKNNYLFTVF